MDTASSFIGCVYENLGQSHFLRLNIAQLFNVLNIKRTKDAIFKWRIIVKFFSVLLFLKYKKYNNPYSLRQ